MASVSSSTSRLVAVAVVALLVGVVLGYAVTSSIVTPPTPITATVTVTQTVEKTVTVSPQVTPAQKIRVAVVYVTPIEEPWNTVMHEAMSWAVTNLNIEYVYTEKVDTADAERVIREYISAGYDIIVPHSWGYHPITIKVAGEFPQVSFAQGSGPTDLAYPPNVVVYDYWIQEAAYLAGVVAGKMTKTNLVGVVTAFAVPDVNRLVNGFAAGVKSVNQAAKVKAVYLESWFDPVKGKEAAKSLIEAGADFIYAERFGPFEACRESTKAGKTVYCFGNVVDQKDLAPDVVLASVGWDLKTFVAKLVEMKRTGTWKGGIYDWGMKDGWARLIWNPDLKTKVPTDVIALVEKLQDDIIAGRLVVPKYEDWVPDRWA